MGHSGPGRGVCVWGVSAKPPEPEHNGSLCTGQRPASLFGGGRLAERDWINSVKRSFGFEHTVSDVHRGLTECSGSFSDIIQEEVLGAACERSYVTCLYAGRMRDTLLNSFSLSLQGTLSHSVDRKSVV